MSLKFNNASNVHGWGRYPVIDSAISYPNSYSDCQGLSKQQLNTVIAQGLGRSYGDSSLSSHIVKSQQLDHFINLNPKTGLLTCQAGVSFANILQVVIAQGWFLPVTPGTQFVTVGGAIASDVHGKNHHLDGSFSDHITQLKLCLASGDIVYCSASQNRELFLATCGGMGLTGIILEATIQLIPITSSEIKETTYKTQNLAETLELFKQHHASTYSVAWIDCLATGNNLGRSLLMLGEHATEAVSNKLTASSHSKLNMPTSLPNFTLNKFSISAFNAMYYGRVRQQESSRVVDYSPFFYPLDSIQNWNRMYGSNGFVQYQFVIPKSAGLEGLSKILTEIANSKRGSFLAVLKVFGQGNDNYLSFPTEGYTLALDFKMDSTLLSFLDKLDEIVLEYGGKLYLTKDSRMSEAVFKQSYPQWQKFQEVRQSVGAHNLFNSLQSQRLGL